MIRSIIKIIIDRKLTKLKDNRNVKDLNKINNRVLINLDQNNRSVNDLDKINKRGINLSRSKIIEVLII